MSQVQVKLKHLKPGQKAILIGYDCSEKSYRSKLLSFGLTPGVVVEMIRSAPMGDPLQIKVRSFDLTLRKDESDCLLLETQDCLNCSFKI